MALTKVSRGLISTSIVDNGNATAITIDSSENVTFAGDGTFSGDVTAGTRVSSSSAGGSRFDLESGDAACSLIANYSSTPVPMVFYTSAQSRMTLDTSGNLTLTTASSSLNIGNGGFISTNYGLLGLNGANGGGIKMGTAGTLQGEVYSNSGGLTFQTPAAYGITWYPAGAFAMKLDTSGNLGIGTSSPAYQLTLSSNPSFWEAGLQTEVVGGNQVLKIVSDAFGGGGRTGNIEFHVNSVSANPAVKINASGNLLVGSDNASPAVGAGVKFLGTTTPYIATVGNSSTSGDNAYLLYSTGAAAYRFYVDYGGTIHATSTSISAISDISLKENIRDLEASIAKVMLLKPRRFDWINGDGKDVAGFIAQELEQVFPELVSESLYAEGVTKKNIKMGDILPTVVKAMQEQQAIIEALTARIEALEGA